MTLGKSDDRRRSTRLRIEKGIVLLRYGGIPPIACTLLDISDGGCRCLVPLGSVDEETAQNWERTLAPDRLLSLEISSPPHLRRLPIDGTVQRVSVIKQGNSVELGLKFRNITAQNISALQRAIVSLATEKIRSATRGPIESNQAARGLVGGPENSRTTPLPQEATKQDARLAAAKALSKFAVPPAPARKSTQPAVPGAPLPQGRKPVNTGERQGPQEPAFESSGLVEILPDDQALRKPAENAAKHSIVPPAEPPIPRPRGTTMLSKQDPFRGLKIGEILVRMGKLTQEQVETSLQEAPLSGGPLGRHFLRQGLITALELCRALALQSGLPMTDLEGVSIEGPLSMIFPYAIMKKHEFVPFDESPDLVCVAAANPPKSETVKELEKVCHRQIEVFLSQEDLVFQQLDRLKPKKIHQNRQHLRYSVQMPVQYQFCTRLGKEIDETLHDGQTVDISEGGFMIDGAPAAQGTPNDLRRRGICLRVLFAQNGFEFDCLCGIRFIKIKNVEDNSHLPWSYGLQILDITDSAKRQLKELCIEAGKSQGGR